MRLKLAAASLCWSLVATAADPSSFYDRSTLEYWRQRYTVSTTKILDQVVWPALLSEEKRRFGGKPVLEFPLYAEGAARQHPLAFYVPPDRPHVVLPVLSLKFLDDLCTAYAWLQINGYSLETISEYTAILRYGEEPGGGFPPPLQALGIPESALDQSQVNELALGHFVTARMWLLLHEMGHVLYGHRRRTNAESVRNEQEADRFAVSVMQRTPLPPLGILVFFMADAHYSGFPASGTDTHPLSGERVRSLADALDSPSLAAKLRVFGEILDDPDIRAGFVATGKAGDLAALGPRRPGELPRRREPTSAPSGAAFDGVYRGECVQFPETTPIVIECVLKRRGDYVTGHYSFGLGIGSIKGKVTGQELHFEWEWAKNFGRGVFRVSANGFAGTWGYRKAESGAGTWTGKRP